ncbi:hypothetical protein [Reyranella sp. CPCC 100927]|uniref:hypothetical protein n=1 Tax=Reyranella sp. CPCC 100927 TaxID=2599616 RepID=UPI0011B84E72|nr:hypothetical protein [Reyranella sp. CPCC 100927]TWT11405.1 hypothetical protein FQU96_13015 [Reyranella sp. CPCC 100927]
MNNVETLLGRSIEDLLDVLKAQHPVVQSIGDCTYVSVRDAGLSFVLPDNKHIDTVQLYAAGKDGYSGFAHPIPGGLTFMMSRVAIRRLLGPPGRTGEATVLPILGKKPPWDRFVLGSLAIHAEYADDVQSVQMFSLTAP